jgi:hypothetical protein
MFQKATLFAEEGWHEAGDVDLNVDDPSLQFQGMGDIGGGGRRGGLGGRFQHFFLARCFRRRHCLPKKDGMRLVM